MTVHEDVANEAVACIEKLLCCTDLPASAQLPQHSQILFSSRTLAESGLGDILREEKSRIVLGHYFSTLLDAVQNQGSNVRLHKKIRARCANIASVLCFAVANWNLSKNGSQNSSLDKQGIGEDPYNPSNISVWLVNRTLDEKGRTNIACLFPGVVSRCSRILRRPFSSLGLEVSRSVLLLWTAFICTVFDDGGLTKSGLLDESLVHSSNWFRDLKSYSQTQVVHNSGNQGSTSDHLQAVSENENYITLEMTLDWLETTRQRVRPLIQVGVVIYFIFLYIKV